MSLKPARLIPDDVWYRFVQGFVLRTKSTQRRGQVRRSDARRLFGLYSGAVVADPHGDRVEAGGEALRYNQVQRPRRILPCSK